MLPRLVPEISPLYAFCDVVVVVGIGDSGSWMKLILLMVLLVAISCHVVLGLVVIWIWFCGLAISCHVVFYVGHLSAFVASTSGQLVDGTIGRYRSSLHSTVVVEEMLAKKEKRAKEWIEKEDEEHSTVNVRKGLNGEKVPKCGERKNVF